MKNNNIPNYVANYPKQYDIEIIANQLQVDTSDIVDVEVLKKGMTNRSFIFRCHDKKYIVRIPGEGTERLINRQEEAAVYDTIKQYHISDDVVYINPKTGYKITAFIENSRVCNSSIPSDLKKAMAVLRNFHQLHLTVDHEFDLFKQIEFYESLWERDSMYEDYTLTKEHITSLRTFIDDNAEQYCLTHVDAIPDNFLFSQDGTVRLIDWEYAGMQDPHVDIAMFCIYALYDRAQIDELINIYFEDYCPSITRIKIYAYIAVCGLLWSNWCEYKHGLGIEFGEYAKRQYEYSKEYYEIVKNELCLLGYGEEPRV